MDKYKISQTPGKSKPLNLKTFWAPKQQRKTLRRKTIITSIVVALIIIIVGVVFAAIHLKNKAAPKAGPLPHDTSQKVPAKGSNSIYTISPATFKAVTSAITAKNLSLVGSYYASEVHVTIVNSSINEVLSSANASNIINAGLSGSTNPWDFHVPASELSQWQSGPYGQYFDGIDIVGISSNGDVISIGFNNSGQIDSVFIAPVDVLDSSGSSTGSNATTTPPPIQTSPQIGNGSD
jgi:cytoskeletal protein RodZ